jgi:hypothetical protein
MKPTTGQYRQGEAMRVLLNSTDAPSASIHGETTGARQEALNT